jgi:hypothetical protein
MASTRLKARDGLDDDFIVYDNDDAGDYYFGELRNLLIDGNRENNSSGHGVYTNNTSNDANDFLISNCFVTAQDNGLQADYTWGYRIKNCLFEFCNGKGIVVASGSQNYISNLFLQANGDIGGEFQATGDRINNIRTNNNAGIGILLQGRRIDASNIYANGNDLSGIDIRLPVQMSNVIARDNGADTNQNNSNRSGIYLRDQADGSHLSNIWLVDDAGTQVAGLWTLGSTTDIQITNAHAEGNTTYGFKINGSRHHLSGFSATNNDLRGLNISGTNHVIENGYASGNSGDDIVVDGTDIRFRNVQFGSIDVSPATRPRWDGVIYGGPLGGTDIGSLTGAYEGDIARSDGTDGSAAADEMFILKANGDWQSIADPTTTITPS